LSKHQVRAAVLLGFEEVARFVGLDPTEQLQKSNIAPFELADHEYWLSAYSVADLLERCARESARSDFSLLLAECRTLSSFGPVSPLLKHEATLGGVVKQLRKYKRHLNDVFDLHLEELAGTTTIHLTVPPPFGRPQVLVLVIAMGYRALTDAMTGTWYPETVHIPVPRPDVNGTFQRFFGSPIEFDSNFAGFSFPTSELRQPNPSADSCAVESATSVLEILPVSVDEIVDRTRHALVLLLPGGHTSLEDVSKNLRLHPRSLQRQLQQAGVQFASLLEDARRSLAALYLRSPARTVSEAAELVGYSSVSSFSRWFTAQFGLSPTKWRRGIA
jgi:AraC-like DNA-binding protein